MSEDERKPKEVEEAEALLIKHYRQPVRPINEYCDALATWARVVVENHEQAEVKEDGRLDPMLALAKALRNEIPIRKSNLLNRLIYMGQQLRTKPCPIHKGHWVGYGYCENDPPCHVAPGYDVTGWLPEGGDEPPEKEVWVELATGEKTEIDWRAKLEADSLSPDPESEVGRESGPERCTCGTSFANDTGAEITVKNCTVEPCPVHSTGSEEGEG